MKIEDALRIAAIFEADDIISIPAMASRVLAKAVHDLEAKIVDLNLEVLKLKDYINP